MTDIKDKVEEVTETVTEEGISRITLPIPKTKPIKKPRQDNLGCQSSAPPLSH